MKENNCRVCLRYRPASVKEGKKFFEIKEKTVLLEQGVKRLKFTFDDIFDQDTDNQTIWKALKNQLLQTSLDGYNVSLLAYGQTGSGKTWTMYGEKNDGLISLFCEALFARIREENQTSATKVTITFIELYNEALHDLLAPALRSSTRQTKEDDANRPEVEESALELKPKVRESPTLGPYLEGVKSVHVKTANQLVSLIKRASNYRTVAQTAMNHKSSRAHTLVTIRYTRDLILEANHSSTQQKHRRISTVHLVDLAGSERVSKSKVQGQRLRETCNINKSLTTLAQVISALATRGKKQHIPYRDSTLTHLLRESLGGNARTTMIATVSPENTDFAETVSTIRYAARARNICNDPHANDINLEPTKQDKAIIRRLEEQVASLKMELEIERSKSKLPNIVQPRSVSIEELRDQMYADMKARIAEMETVMATAADFSLVNHENEDDDMNLFSKCMPQQTNSFDEQDIDDFLDAAAKEAFCPDEEQLLGPTPALIPLHQDSEQDSSRIELNRYQNDIILGSASNADIIIHGDGIAEKHAVITLSTESNQPVLTLLAHEGQTHLNGRKLVQNESCPLKHDDCLIFGSRAIVYRIATSEPTASSATWEEAMHALTIADCGILRTSQDGCYTERNLELDSELRHIKHLINETKELAAKLGHEVSTLKVTIFPVIVLTDTYHKKSGTNFRLARLRMSAGVVYFRPPGREEVWTQEHLEHVVKGLRETSTLRIEPPSEIFLGIACARLFPLRDCKPVDIMTKALDRKGRPIATLRIRISFQLPFNGAKLSVLRGSKLHYSIRLDLTSATPSIISSEEEFTASYSFYDRSPVIARSSEGRMQDGTWFHSYSDSINVTERFADYLKSDRLLLEFRRRPSYSPQASSLKGDR